MSIYYKPQDYGTIGQGDDTAAIQGAVNAIRSAGGGVLQLDQPMNIGGINARGCNNLEIISHSCCVHRTLPLPQNGVILDLTGSAGVSIEKFNLVGPQSYEPNTGAAILLGQLPGTTGVDRITLDRVWINGRFTSAVIGDIGGTSISFRDCQMVQWDTGSPTLVLSTRADWNLVSQFGPLCSELNGTEASIVGDIYFDGYTETHQLNHGAWTVYIRNGDHIRLGGLSANSNRAHILMQGYCRHIVDIARKYYAGDGVEQDAEMVYEVGQGSSAVGLVSINPCRDEVTRLMGPQNLMQNFQYCQAIPQQS